MAFQDLLLDDGGDLAINSKGNLDITDSVIQAIQIKLRWAYGEWAYNPDFGVPYFEKVFIKNPDKIEIENILRSEILSVEEVLSIDSFSLVLNKKNRTATVKFTVSTASGNATGEVTL